jgi:hypothetical protein
MWEGHGTEDCVVSMYKVVCVNSRVAHVAGDPEVSGVREAG